MCHIGSNVYINKNILNHADFERSEIFRSNHLSYSLFLSYFSLSSWWSWPVAVILVTRWHSIAPSRKRSCVPYTCYSRSVNARLAPSTCNRLPVSNHWPIGAHLCYGTGSVIWPWFSQSCCCSSGTATRVTLLWNKWVSERSAAVS